MFEQEAGLDFHNIEELRAEVGSYQLTKPIFNFLQAHNGFRKGAMHGLLGKTGQGKSSLVRSIIVDLLKNHKVLFYSTEETRKDLTMVFSRLDDHTNFKNFFFTHEQDIVGTSGTDLEKWENEVRIKIMNSEADIFIFDNLTTSEIYEDIKKSMQLLNILHKIKRDFNIPILVVAHTDSKYRSQWPMGPEDVRGMKQLSNKCEYFYCFERFHFHFRDNPIQASTIKLTKYRGYVVEGAFYQLNFDVKTMLYTSDYSITSKKYMVYFKEEKNGRDSKGN